MKGIIADKLVVVKGKEFIVEYVRGSGRNASARLNGNVIRIKIPGFLNGRDTLSTFLSLKERMVKKLEKVDLDSIESKDLEFYDGQEFSAMGKRFVIKLEESEDGTRRAGMNGDVIRIRLGKGVREEEKKRYVSAASRRIISRKLLPDLRFRIDELNSKYFEFDFNNVKIRNQMTRWGSYSSKTANIYLNFKLFFAPSEILDYVIVHELAHIKKRDHSKEFWTLVAEAVPDYKERRKWLNKNGNKISPNPILY